MTLWCRDPASFCTGEGHNHYYQWQDTSGNSPSAQQAQVLKLTKVSILKYFQCSFGSFKGKKLVVSVVCVFCEKHIVRSLNLGGNFAKG